MNITFPQAIWLTIAAFGFLFITFGSLLTGYLDEKGRRIPLFIVGPMSLGITIFGLGKILELLGQEDDFIVRMIFLTIFLIIWDVLWVRIGSDLRTD